MPECFAHVLKTFEVHSKWRNIKPHTKCILTALWLHSIFRKYSYGPLRHSNSIQNILIAIEGESKRQATSNSARISQMRLEWARMHLECISIAAGIYFDIKIIQLKCNSISRNIQTISIPTSFWLILPLVWLGFEIPSRMWHEFWKFFIRLVLLDSCWFQCLGSMKWT